MELLTLVALGALQVTSYRSVPAQTDASPHHTSINWQTNPAVVAISQDMLKSGEVSYGDVLYVPGYGARIVSDVMNERHKRAIDLWVATEREEAAVGTRRITVYVMRMPERERNRREAMACVNGKQVQTLIRTFIRQNGREPSNQELLRLMRGGR